MGDTVGDWLGDTAGDGLVDEAGEAAGDETAGDEAGLGERADERRDGLCADFGAPADVAFPLGVLIPGTAPGVPAGVGVATTLLPGEG